MFINEKFRFSRIKSMPYRMVWHINDFCNFGCSYCFFPKFDKEDPSVGRLNPQQIYDALKKTGKNWHLFIAGGEPLLYPNFIELVNLLKQDHPIQISTNLYNKNVKAFAEQVSPDNIILINASLHILHHNDKSLRKFIENYHLFLSKGFEIGVSYVTYPPLFDRIKDDFQFLKDEGVKYVFPLTFSGTFKGKKYPGNYTLKQMRIISEIYQEPLELLLGMEKMNFNGKLCKAGQGYFYMEKNGEVYRCASIRKSYGNLFEGTFIPDTVPQLCNVDTCYDHCHGIMSVVEEPEAPVIPPPSLLEKGYLEFNNILKHFNSGKPIKITVPSRKAQEEFIRK